MHADPNMECTKCRMHENVNTEGVICMKSWETKTQVPQPNKMQASFFAELSFAQKVKTFQITNKYDEDTVQLIELFRNDKPSNSAERLTLHGVSLRSFYKCNR